MAKPSFGIETQQKQTNGKSVQLDIGRVHTHTRARTSYLFHLKGGKFHIGQEKGREMKMAALMAAAGAGCVPARFARRSCHGLPRNGVSRAPVTAATVRDC